MGFPLDGVGSSLRQNRPAWEKWWVPWFWFTRCSRWPPSRRNGVQTGVESPESWRNWVTLDFLGRRRFFSVSLPRKSKTIKMIVPNCGMIQIPKPKTIVNLVKFPILVIVFQLLRPRDRGCLYNHLVFRKVYGKVPFETTILSFGGSPGSLRRAPSIWDFFSMGNSLQNWIPIPGCYIQTVLGWGPVGWQVTLCFFLGGEFVWMEKITTGSLTV